MAGPVTPVTADGDADYNAMLRDDKTTVAHAPDPTGEMDYSKLKTDTEFQTPAFDLRTQIDHVIEPAVKDFSRHYGNSKKAIHNGMLYSEVLKGKRTLEQAKELSQSPDLEPDLSPFAGPLGFAAEQLPPLQEMAKNWAVGFAAGAPMGAAAGAVLAAPTGEVAAPITVPGMAMSVGSVSGTLAAANVNGEVAAGNLFKDMVEAGVDQEKAKLISITGGWAVGALQVFGAGQWAKQIFTAAGKEAGKKWTVEYFKAAGINLLDIEAQNLVTTFSDALGRYSSGITNKDLPKKLVDGLLQAIPQALGLSALTVGGGRVLGALKGKGDSEAIPEPHVDLKSPADILAATLATLDGKPIPEKKVLTGRVTVSANKAPRDKIEALVVEKDKIKDGLSEAELHGTLEEIAAIKEDLKEISEQLRDAIADKKAEDLANLKQEHKEAQLEADRLTAKITKLQAIKSAANEAKTLQGEIDEQVPKLKAANLAARTAKEQIIKIEKSALKKGVERLQGELERSKPKGKESRFDPESSTQEMLDTYRKFVHDKKAAQDAIDLYESELNNPNSKSTPEGIDALRAAAEAAEDTLALTDGPSYAALAKKIKGITDGAIKDRKAQLAERRAADNALTDEMVTAANGDKPVTLGNDGKMIPLATEPVAPPAQFVRRFGGVSFLDKLKIVTQDNKTLQPVVAKIDKMVNGAVDAVQAGKEQQLENLMGHLTAKTGLGKSEVLKLIHDGNRKLGTKKEPVVHTNAENAPSAWHGTINEAVDALMRMRQARTSKEVEAGITKGNKYTLGDVPGTTEYALKEALGEVSPKYFELMDGLFDFYKEYGERYADAYKRTTGLTLKLEENYSGPVQRIGANQSILEKFIATIKPATQRSKFSVGVTGSSIAKVESAAAIRPQNPFVNAVKHINATEHYINLVDISKTLNRVFTSSRLQEIVTHKYGAAHWNAIQIHLDAVLNKNGLMQDHWVDMLDSVTRGAGTAMLGLKPQAIVKQATGWVNFAMEVPTAKLATGTAEFWVNPAKHAEILMQSPILKRRYGDFVDTQAGVGMQKTLDSTRVDTFNDAAMMPVKLGDKLASMPGAWAAYKHFQTKEGGGLSHEAALEKAAMIVERTQSSSRPDLTSNFSRNPYLRAVGFSQFTQPVQQLLGYETGAWRHAMNYPDLPNLAAAIKASTVTRLSQAAFVAVDALIIHQFHQWGIAKKDEVDNAWWSVARAFALGTQMPILGTVVSGVAIEAQNKIVSKQVNKMSGGRIPKSHEHWFSPSALVTSVGENTIRLGKDAVGVIERGELTTKDALNIGLHWARSGNIALDPKFGGGLPIEYPLKILKRIVGEREQVLIKTPWKDIHSDGGED